MSSFKCSIYLFDVDYVIKNNIAGLVKYIMHILQCLQTIPIFHT